MSELDIQYIADLVTQAQDGDSNAFAELFAATYQKQYGFACKYLGNDFLAQQALQSAYVQALKKLFTLREPTLFVVWLNQHIMRACFQLQTEEIPPTPSSHSEDQIPPEKRMLKINGTAYTAGQILTLPLSEAQTILLCHLCSQKTGETASLLEIRRSDVRRYLRSGYARLHSLTVQKEGK